MSVIGVVLSIFAMSSGTMILTWAIARKINNYSIVDAVWSLLFVVNAWMLLLTAPGWTVRKILMSVLVSVWGLRLGIFLSKRIANHHPHEDGRYLALRKEYSPSIASGFFKFYLLQAVSVVLLSAPFVVISFNSSHRLLTIEIIGALIWIISWLGESLSDRQMSRFKQDPLNRGKVCDHGLWRYSRHPNYFFEACIWWGIFVFSLGWPLGWTTIFCPLGMTYLLLFVTGVPMAEEQSLRTRGEAYREYQKTTSSFVPLPRRLRKSKELKVS